ncbi:MAG: hypothetical protein JSW49_05355 [candidate division WOR-3 bacterium]|nr:MAG: hypothetical protein JSW49_05355 [candidate division WOR-3 bacterium]
MMGYRFVIVITLIACVSSSANAAGLTVRFGGGMLYDERPPDGTLGGGQLALEIRMNRLPLAFQAASEYWSKGSLEYPYEIESYTAAKVLLVGYVGKMLSFLYTRPVDIKTAYVYLGGGAGMIRVPKIDRPNERETGLAFDAIFGANIRLIWKLGIFAEGKYLYSTKTSNDVKVIDFSDFGFLVGLSLNFDI